MGYRLIQSEVQETTIDDIQYDSGIDNEGFGGGGQEQ